MLSLAQIERAARRAGGQVQRVRRAGGAIGELRVRVRMPNVDDGDAWGPARLLGALADENAADPAVQAIAGAVVRGGAPEDRPRAIHALVKHRVAYEEPRSPQRFAGADYTLRRGIGSCPEHGAALVYGIGKAAGVPARLVFFTRGGLPRHVVAQLADSAAVPRWQWAETTVDAEYGEHPVRAAERLGMGRPDLDGEEVIMRHRGIGLILPDGTAAPYLDDTDGSAFAQELVTDTAGVVTDPLDVLKLLLSESGLNPAQPSHVLGPDGSPVAYGIYQVLGSQIPGGMSPSQWLALSAQQQMPYAASSWRSAAASVGAALPVQGRDLYWLNFVPDSFAPGSADDYAFVFAGDPSKHGGHDYYIRGRDGAEITAPGFYSDNAGFDTARKGSITAGDMQAALDRQEAAHPHLYPYLAPMIEQLSPGAGGGGGIVATITSGGNLVRLALGAAAGGALIAAVDPNARRVMRRWFTSAGRALE